MTNSELKDRLLQLLPENDFQNQDKAIAWATKILALLNKLHNKKPLPEQLQDLKNIYEFEKLSKSFAINFSNDNIKSILPRMKQIITYEIEKIKITEEEENELRHKSFRKGDHLSYQIHMSKIIATANKSIWFMDPYMGHIVFEELINTTATEINLLKKQRTKDHDLFQTRFNAAKKQFEDKTIQLRYADTFHDRYLIIDSTYAWKLGGSFDQYSGNKNTAVDKLTNESAIKNAIDEFEALWNSSNISQ